MAAASTMDARCNRITNQADSTKGSPFKTLH